MLTRYERTVARRYLWPGKGEGIIAVVAAFSLLGVTIGVAALVIVTSVMNGFSAELFDKTISLTGHAVIQGYGGRIPDWRQVVAEAKATPGVTAATPLIEQPLMGSAAGRVEGVLVRGMTMADIRGPAIAGKVVIGNIAEVAPGAGNVAIGARLAEAMGVTVGDQLGLINPAGQASPFGTVPRIVSYRIAAVIEVGVYDYDNTFVVMPIPDAQTLLLLGDAVGMVKVQTADAERVGAILDPLRPKLRGIAVVQDWRQLNGALFQTIQIERVTMFIILSIMVLEAAFIILVSLVMLVRAKTRDIAILRTMGASRAAVMRIFLGVGLILGGIGTAAGLLIAGLALTYRQAVVNLVQRITGQNLWDPSVRFLTELPSRTDPGEVMLVVAMTFTLTFLFTLYPALRAARTDPVQVLRYE